MTSDWSALRAALARSRRQGLQLPIWWRDDDAVEPTVALDHLQDIALRLGVPVHLAVIPSTASSDLGRVVLESPVFNALIHGWEHLNHAPEACKKSEFGQARAGAVRELEAGYHRVTTLFERKSLPVFVPPWNRMHDDYLPDLARIGVRAVSTFGARAEPNPYPGLLQINCHIDPINWRGDRGLVSEGEIIAGTIAHIESRIEGREDNFEPLGYLTHHLVHTEEIWAFTYKFLNELLDGGAESEPLSCFLEQKS